MQSNPVSQNGATDHHGSAPSPLTAAFCDLWYDSGKVRTIVDSVGTPTTLIYDQPSHTVMQFPAGGRATLPWCPSQMTSPPETLSQFGAHVQLRTGTNGASSRAEASAFLAHPETQRQIAEATFRSLRAPLKRARWFQDVIQEANLQLLKKLRRGKVIFDGDDPERFRSWIHRVCRHVVVDAIRLCLRTFPELNQAPASSGTATANTPDPVEGIIKSEMARLIVQEIECIADPKLREVMVDLHEGRSVRESARKLGIAKSIVDRLRNHGRRLINLRLDR